MHCLSALITPATVSRSETDGYYGYWHCRRIISSAAFLPSLFPSPPLPSHIHTHTQVLHLEQLLTTGGGWQDQCGGLYGGVKISHSQKQLPVHITTKQIGT